MGRPISRRAFIEGSTLGAIAATTKGEGMGLVADSTLLKLERRTGVDRLFDHTRKTNDANAYEQLPGQKKGLTRRGDNSIITCD